MKKIIAIVVAVAFVGVGLFQVVPAMADSPRPLHRVQITPATATLAPGATLQFTAQGYDATNAPVPNASYFWMVTAGGGSITVAGLFMAGGVAGTYTNTVQVVAVQGDVTKTANATVVVTGTAGALDRVVVTPASANLAPGGTMQFLAQGYDASQVAIPGLTFTWTVLGGGGTINPTTGLFTAGAATGTFPNTVQASTTLNSVTRSGNASVTVGATATPPPTPSPKADTVDKDKLVRLFTGLLRSIRFEDFLGGQWQVKNGAAMDTIKAIPGVVQMVSGTSLTMLPNLQGAASSFNLNGATILPKGTQLAANDRVVVLTVNDQVVLVMKIEAPRTSGAMPPGLGKRDDDKREGKHTPPGWSRGKKTGWNKGGGDDEDD